jgi:hypothetical protein
VQSALRPYATAGVAIVGASVIAITPVAAPLPDTATVRDVALTAGDAALGDFLNPWIDQYNTAVTDYTQIANNYYLAPGVGMQQFMVNSAELLKELFNDPSKLGDIAIQTQDNLNTVFQTETLLGADSDTVDAVAKQTLDSCALSCHTFVYSLLPGLLPPDLVEPLQPLINFIASPMSGVLIGALGPFIAPFVALGNSISDGDGFSEILANTVGAFFNGATLDLDALLPLLNSGTLLPLPEAISFTHLDVAFGGLFSQGVVSNGPWELYDSDGDPFISVPSVGGSLFNSLGMGIQAGATAISADSHAIGPLGALQGLSEIIGLQLGDDWNGKVDPTSFTKYPAFPPGAGLEPPTIPDLPTSDAGDAGDAGATAAGSFDFSDFFHDFF